MIPVDEEIVEFWIVIDEVELEVFEFVFGTDF